MFESSEATTEASDARLSSGCAAVEVHGPDDSFLFSGNTKDATKEVTPSSPLSGRSGMRDVDSVSRDEDSAVIFRNTRTLANMPSLLRIPHSFVSENEKDRQLFERRLLIPITFDSEPPC